MSQQTLNIIDWDILSHDKYALTIENVLNMKPGEQIKVLSMDRNVWDCALDNKQKQGKSFKPQEFFKDCWAIYINTDTLKGKCLFAWEFDDDQTEQVNVEQINSDDFEFDIEYNNNEWYPLEDE